MNYTHIRNIVFQNQPQIGKVPGESGLILEDDLVVDIKLEYRENVGGIDIVDNDEHRVIVYKGLVLERHPFPKWLCWILKMSGVELNPALSLIHKALYEEGGLEVYSREQVDRLCIDSMLGNIKNPVKKLLLDMLMEMFVGSSLAWKRDGDSTKYAMIEPI